MFPGSGLLELREAFPYLLHGCDLFHIAVHDLIGFYLIVYPPWINGQKMKGFKHLIPRSTLSAFSSDFCFLKGKPVNVN